MTLEFQTLFPIAGIIVISMALISIIWGVSNWKRNNRSPELSVAATLVAKRVDTVQQHHQAGYGSHLITARQCTATFQVESGDRLELQVPDYEYNFLTEGDTGKLTFKGSWFVKFERQS